MNFRHLLTLSAFGFGLSTPSQSHAAITAGVLSNFQNDTVQGWSGGANPAHVANGGPMGVGDGFLRIGGGRNMATFNTGSSYSGVMDAAVTSFEVSMMRPASDPSSLEMRLVLFGPGSTNAWTSTASQQVSNDGVWRVYSFSTQESDLTQVRGSASFGELMTSVDRVMLRHDPEAPSRGGASAAGTLGIDNVTAVPESSSVWLIVASEALLARRRRQ